MKLLEIILCLSIAFLLILSIRFNLDFEIELIRIETRNEFIYSLVYARSRAILLRERVFYVFARKDTDNTETENNRYLKIVSDTGGKTSVVNFTPVNPRVQIDGFETEEDYSPFHFTGNGNARSGTLRWEVGEENERIVVNNRGRFRWGK